ncbi:MAG: periplasmic protein TonB, partial [Acidobacteriaceae bacterium]
TPVRVMSEIPDITEPEHLEIPKENPSSVASSPAEVIRPTGLWANVNEYWTTILTVAVIGSAFLLGWSWGHGNPHRARQGITSAAAAEQQPVSITPTSKDTSHKPESDQDSPRPPVKQERSQNSSDDLIVYEKGRVVYRSKADNPGAGSIVRRPLPSSLPVGNVAPRIVHRVEPVYPASALRQRIAGPVEVLTLVDKSGTVEEVKVISGDPILAEAAMEAISRWRFQPLMKDGKAVGFQTRIKVGFKLPK